MSLLAVIIATIGATMLFVADFYPKRTVMLNVYGIVTLICGIAVVL